MVRRTLTVFLFFVLLRTFALEPLTQEAARSRLAALEGLLAAKSALTDSKWQELKKIDKSISARWQEAVDAEDDEASGAKAEKVLDMEERLSQLHARRLNLAQQINTAYEEEKALRDQISQLKEMLALKDQVLDGKWLITLMPAEQKGELYLTQNGTLIDGEYKLDGGQTGNVQGIFIKGHLVLERIDSQYGRMGKLEAQLMKDQNSLKGTWYAYDIASGQPLTGALVIERPPKETPQ